MNDFPPVDDPADLVAWLDTVAAKTRKLREELAAERALADDAATLLKDFRGTFKPTITIADIDAWLARYREARDQ